MHFPTKNILTFVTNYIIKHDIAYLCWKWKNSQLTTVTNHVNKSNLQQVKNIQWKPNDNCILEQLGNNTRRGSQTKAVGNGKYASV